LAIASVLAGGGIFAASGYMGANAPAPFQSSFPAAGAFLAMICYYGALRIETEDLHRRVLRLEAELQRQERASTTAEGGQFFRRDA
jgi:hypothetical protein